MQNRKNDALKTLCRKLTIGYFARINRAAATKYNEVECEK